MSDPARPAKLLAGGYQGTQARRVQETDPAQVRDDVNGAVAGQVQHPLTELAGLVQASMSPSIRSTARSPPAATDSRCETPPSGLRDVRFAVSASWPAASAQRRYA